MNAQRFFVLSEDDVDALRALNTAERAVEPRLVDGPGHPLAGSYVLPASLVAADGYEPWAAILGEITARNLILEGLFAPAFEL